MQTFEISLDPVNWTEIAFGYNTVAFDILQANAVVEVYFTETATDPGAVTGNPVAGWASQWDLYVTGMDKTIQRVWVRGKGAIRGARQ